MKLKTLVVAVSACLAGSAVAAGSIEDRISALEQQVSKNTVYVNAPDNTVVNHVKGVQVSLGGDVEYDLDATSKGGNISHDQTHHENWGMGGRIRVSIGADQTTSAGYFAGVLAQPDLKIDGSVGAGDAEVHFGHKDDWQLKIGRFEAYDMFPLNQDTFVDYAADSSNEVYRDGSGYTYQMKEGRGRTTSILYSKELGNWYFETNTAIKDGTKWFDGYHGRDLENNKNVIIVRPVIAYSNGPWTTAFAAESNVIHNAYGYTDKNGHFVDQSKRTGLGATLKYDDSNIVWNLSAATLNAADENDTSVGTNIWWNNYELGYIYAHNDVKRFSSNSNNSGFNSPGRYDIHTVHASYKFDNVLDMQNLNLYLGGYASFIDSGATHDNNSVDDRYGVRARVKYFF